MTTKVGKNLKEYLSPFFLSLIILSVILPLLSPSIALALAPEEILVVTNRAVSESTDLGRYYMKKRGVPSDNLIQVSTSKGEYLSREAYDKEIASPVRSFLTKNDPEGKKFKCILLMCGIPLRINHPPMTAEEKAELQKLRERARDLSNKIKTVEKKDEKEAKTLRDEASSVQRQIQAADKFSDGSAVDSEMALVMEPQYPVRGWLPNRYFAFFRGKQLPNMPQKVLLVSRLDGPSEAIVRRIIDDSIEIEAAGLSGKAYFDARWPDKGGKTGSSYEMYDHSIHETARLLRKSGKMPVVLDEKGSLFQSGEAPDAALYCGWYSLAKYVDAFTWAKGAVGFHVASSECTTLKNKGSQVWCKVMLEKGVVATVGPVAEPYLTAFPSPEVFFSCLVDGRLSLSECYGLSNPFWSWQMILVGDPLYRPFRHH
ncbi:MAG: TIGR03790 family protein [Nitrospirales bacterium]|nr:TIGR03790 family protein [Nitrospirales bacterium]